VLLAKKMPGATFGEANARMVVARVIPVASARGLWGIVPGLPAFSLRDDPFCIFGRRMPILTDMGRTLETAENEPIAADLLADFEAAARRPLRQRMRYAFIHTHKPVLDDAPFRAFDTTADYRRWCEQNLPDWLGYGRVRLPTG